VEEYRKKMNDLEHRIFEENELLVAIEHDVRDKALPKLRDPEQKWHPSDLLPDSSQPKELFLRQVGTLVDEWDGVDLMYIHCFLGAKITEEGLPTFSRMLGSLPALADPSGCSQKPWHRWSREWSAEESTHDQLLNIATYFSRRVDSRRLDVTGYNFIRNGMDLKLNHHPTLIVLYPLMQELATCISHNQMGDRMREQGAELLSTFCHHAGKDEARHFTAYKDMARGLIREAPEVVLSVFKEYFVDNNLVMPGEFMDDGKTNGLFSIYSIAAQKAGVYTARNYKDNFARVVRVLGISDLCVSGKAADDQEAIMGQCNRLERGACIMEKRIKKMKLPEQLPWINYDL